MEKRCLIIDDDPLICDLIKHFCAKQSWISSTLSVGDGNQALQALSTQSFDLVFLDYNLPDLKGKSLLELMPEKTPTIMVTTEEAFGAESYEYDQIIDFLLKPISYERFLKAMVRFQQLNDQPKPVSTLSGTLKPKENKLIVKDGNASVIVKLDQVFYIKSEGNYAVFHLADRRIMSLLSLKKLEEILPQNFVRTQKSFIINLDYLEVIESHCVKMNGIEIPIGAKHSQIFHERFSAWSKSH